jgi:phage shock protein A
MRKKKQDAPDPGRKRLENEIAILKENERALRQRAAECVTQGKDELGEQAVQAASQIATLIEQLETRLKLLQTADRPKAE